jgi:hypothetical protein
LSCDTSVTCSCIKPSSALLAFSSPSGTYETTSRKLRLVLGFSAIPMLIVVFGIVESISSKPGVGSINSFVEESERLIKEGKTQVLLEALRDYRAQGKSRLINPLGAADAARSLTFALQHQELIFDLQTEERASAKDQ